MIKERITLLKSRVNENLAKARRGRKGKKAPEFDTPEQEEKAKHLAAHAVWNQIQRDKYTGLEERLRATQEGKGVKEKKSIKERADAYSNKAREHDRKADKAEDFLGWNAPKFLGLPEGYEDLKDPNAKIAAREIFDKIGFDPKLPMVPISDTANHRHASDWHFDQGLKRGATNAQRQYHHLKSKHHDDLSGPDEETKVGYKGFDDYKKEPKSSEKYEDMDHPYDEHLRTTRNHDSKKRIIERLKKVTDSLGQAEGAGEESSSERSAKSDTLGDLIKHPYIKQDERAEILAKNPDIYQSMASAYHGGYNAGGKTAHLFHDMKLHDSVLDNNPHPDVLRTMMEKMQPRLSAKAKKKLQSSENPAVRNIHYGNKDFNDKDEYLEAIKNEKDSLPDVIGGLAKNPMFGAVDSETQKKMLDVLHNNKDKHRQELADLEGKNISSEAMNHLLKKDPVAYHGKLNKKHSLDSDVFESMMKHPEGDISNRVFSALPEMEDKEMFKKGMGELTDRLMSHHEELMAPGAADIGYRPWGDKDAGRLKDSWDKAMRSENGMEIRRDMLKKLGKSGMVEAAKRGKEDDRVGRRGRGDEAHAAQKRAKSLVYEAMRNKGDEYRDEHFDVGSDIADFAAKHFPDKVNEGHLSELSPKGWGHLVGGKNMKELKALYNNQGWGHDEEDPKSRETHAKHFEPFVKRAKQLYKQAKKETPYKMSGLGPIKDPEHLAETRGHLAELTRGMIENGLPMHHVKELVNMAGLPDTSHIYHPDHTKEHVQKAFEALKPFVGAPEDLRDTLGKLTKSPHFTNEMAEEFMKGKPPLDLVEEMNENPNVNLDHAKILDGLEGRDVHDYISGNAEHFEPKHWKQITKNFEDKPLNMPAEAFGHMPREQAQDMLTEHHHPRQWHKFADRDDVTHEHLGDYPVNKVDDEEIHPKVLRTMHRPPDSDFGGKLDHSHLTNEAEHVSDPTAVNHLRTMLHNNDGEMRWADIKKEMPQWENLEGIKQAVGGKAVVKLTDVEKNLQNAPKKKWHITHDKWDGMQRHNGDDDGHQMVVQLNTHQDLEDELKKEGLHDTFKTVQKAAYSSGHPTLPHSVGWGRVDVSNPKHWFVDEIQSDLMATMSPDRLGRNFDKDKAKNMEGDLKNIKKKMGDWHDHLLNHVMTLAQKHGAERVSMHTPESKAAMNYGYERRENPPSKYKDIYGKMPKRSGFKTEKARDVGMVDEDTETGNPHKIKTGHFGDKEYDSVNTYHLADRHNIPHPKLLIEPKDRVKEEKVEAPKLPEAPRVKAG
jgi:hypothetical protein